MERNTDTKMIQHKMGSLERVHEFLDCWQIDEGFQKQKGSIPVSTIPHIDDFVKIGNIGRRLIFHPSIKNIMALKVGGYEKVFA